MYPAQENQSTNSSSYWNEVNGNWHLYIEDFKGRDANIPIDLKRQMIVCYKNIAKVLDHFGGTLENVVDEKLK